MAPAMGGGIPSLSGSFSNWQQWCYPGKPGAALLGESCRGVGGETGQGVWD